MKTSYLHLMFLLILLLSGCTQQLTKGALRNDNANTHKIAVIPFARDSVNFSEKLRMSLSKQLDSRGRPAVNVIDPTDTEALISKKNISSAKLSDRSTMVEIGSLLEAKTVISGSIDGPVIDDDPYAVEHTKCEGNDDNRQCWRIKVSCQKRSVALSAHIHIVDVATGETLYNDDLHRQQQWDHCADDTDVLPSIAYSAGILATDIADDLTDKLQNR